MNRFVVNLAAFSIHSISGQKHRQPSSVATEADARKAAKTLTGHWDYKAEEVRLCEQFLMGRETWQNVFCVFGFVMCVV